MLNWLREKASAAECLYFRLDSGTARAQAHKFYFNQGFSIGALLFSERLTESEQAVMTLIHLAWATYQNRFLKVRSAPPDNRSVPGAVSSVSPRLQPQRPVRRRYFDSQ